MRGKKEPAKSVASSIEAAGLALPVYQKRTEVARERLLDAAQREFGRHGFHGTAVADLVREADVSIGGFYRRFKDKETLFFALQQRMHESESVAINRFFDNPKRREQTLQEIHRQLVVNTYKGMSRHSGYFRAFVELTQRDAIVWERMTDLEALQAQRLAELVVARGLATMSAELVEKAHLATRTVNGYIIIHVLYQPKRFSPMDPLVVNGLADIFESFTVS